MKLIIDRFEQNFAICENPETKEFLNIKKSLLPQNAKESDIINLENDIITIDYEETKNRAEIIKTKMDNLWE